MRYLMLRFYFQGRERPNTICVPFEDEFISPEINLNKELTVEGFSIFADSGKVQAKTLKILPTMLDSVEVTTHICTVNEAKQIGEIKCSLI